MATVLSWKNVGTPADPQDIRRARRQVMDLLRYQGQPVILRHRWNELDVTNGVAKKCPLCYDSVYNQVRNDCVACFGVGFVSVENNTDGIYITKSNALTVGDQDMTGVLAPRYGGFGPSFLTWMIQPDVAEDVFRINEQGALIRTFQATGVAPWYPNLGDNDLCINVLLESDRLTVASTLDRFVLRQVNPMTIRGFGNRYQGHQFLIQQSFQMTKLPLSNVLYQVPHDPS